MAGTFEPIEAATSGGPMSLNVQWYEDLVATKLGRLRVTEQAGSFGDRQSLR